MFSASKILFSKSPLSTEPLSIAVQPQNVTVKAGESTTIGQTTWMTGAGYKRTMVSWERSVDGNNWFAESSSFQQDGGFPKTADLAQSGLKYRAYAWAYSQYTYLPNYFGEGVVAYETATTGSYTLLSIRGGKTGDFAFLFLKGGEFRLNIYFDGQYSDTGNLSNAAQLAVVIGNRSVAYIRNVGAIWDGNTVRQPENVEMGVIFTANPGELMDFNYYPNSAHPESNPQYIFDIASTAQVGSGQPMVVSEPFTLTVTP